MMRTVQFILPFVVACLAASCGEREKLPTTGSGREVERSEADRLLRGAHFLTTLRQAHLSGRIRHEEDSLPVELSRRGEHLQLVYRDPEDGEAVRLHSRPNDGDYEIYELVGGEAWECSEGRLQESVGGTGFAHEDVLMPWLLWPNGEIVGKEMIGGLDAWKIRVRNPRGRRGRASCEVEVWVDEVHGALVQAVCYDGMGRARKRFRVMEVERVGNGVHAVRSGRLDRLDPETSEVVGLSILEFDRTDLVGAVE